MSSKNWIIYFFITCSCFVFLIATINYYIDPDWTFNHRNQLNQAQKDYDERQQKTNMVTFEAFNYDTLILGNSVITYMNQNDLQGFNAFNYAVNGMSINEFEGYIEYAKEQNKRDFDYIIIGLFLNLTDGTSDPKVTDDIKSSFYYFDKSNELYYRYKNLFSADTFKHSITNIISSIRPTDKFAYYDRENVKFKPMVSNSFKDVYIQRQKIIFGNQYKDPNYKYQSDQLIYDNLKKNNPNTKFIIFTEPIAKPLLDLFDKYDRFDEYSAWLNELISNFGEIYNFSYHNSITGNLDLYYDAMHTTPEVMKLVAKKITNSNEGVPADFGMLVTKESIEDHVNLIRENLIKSGTETLLSGLSAHP